MRIPIAIGVQSCDLSKSQVTIDEIRAAFLDYLARVPRKSTRSKHGVMGPIGKILSEVKSGRRDPAELKGFAIRADESLRRDIRRDSGGKVSAMIAPRELQCLEKGIDLLIGLLKSLPIDVADRIVEQLNHGLYFDLRKRDVERKESRRQQWVAFLKGRYGDEARLSEAWGEAIKSVEEAYLPKKSEGSTGKNAKPKQRDIAEFYDKSGTTTTEEEED